MVKRYDLREINKYAKDLSGLKFVLENDHDDSIAAIKSDKEKLADLIISAGFELVMLQRRHEKNLVALQLLLDNPHSIGPGALMAILEHDEKMRVAGDTVGEKPKKSRGESVLPDVQDVVPSDG